MITRAEEDEMNRLFAGLTVKTALGVSIKDDPDASRFRDLVGRSILEGRESAEPREFSGLQRRFS